MDLKTFGEADFDSKKWINKAWSSSGNQEKEIFVANSVTRLQLYMKQLTNSLDETTTQIVTSIPRVLQDASALQLEGALLQQRLQSLESKVQGVEEQTGHSIMSLQRIDQLKSRLENAASALREADKWAALATSLEEILETGVPTQIDKLNELAEQVAAMTASLEVLSDAPDYEHKRLQLETLYNRLEAAVSPPLIEALTQMDAESTARYVSVFGGMSRGASAGRCWRRAAAARLAAAWRRHHHHSLHALTSLLAAEANKQVDWLTSVLKSETPVTELIRLYTDLLLSLEPSPTKVVSANLKLCSTPEEGIMLLCDLKRDIDEFVACITSVMDAPRQQKESVPAAAARELGRAAHAPLRELLPRYTELQGQLFLANLNDTHLNQGDLLEHSRALLSIAERCEGWLSTAYSRAKKIAGIAVYPFYASSVEAFITALSSHISSHSRRIETAFLSSTTAGQTAGVLSNTFPASLVLETAAAVLLDTLAERQKVEQADEEMPVIVQPSSEVALPQSASIDLLPVYLKVTQPTPLPPTESTPPPPSITPSPPIPASTEQCSTQCCKNSILEMEYRDRQARANEVHELETAILKEKIRETKAKADLAELLLRQQQNLSEPSDQPPLLDLPALLLDAEARQRLSALRAEPQACVAGLRRAKDQLRGLARAILRNPVDAQLDKIPQLSVWSNNDALSTDLPDFALSPQEYITEIGQYLMTLPQHLEMHLSEKQAPWQFLSEVCTHTCEVYAEKILNIRNMDALGTKRCLTDIVYLCSVVEDLGTNVTPALRNLEKSLRAAAPAHNQLD